MLLIKPLFILEATKRPLPVSHSPFTRPGALTGDLDGASTRRIENSPTETNTAGGFAYPEYFRNRAGNTSGAVANLRCCSVRTLLGTECRIPPKISLFAFLSCELKLISSRFQHNNKRRALCLPDFPSCHWLKHLP